MMKNSKKDQVERFLNAKMETNNFTIDDLLEMTADELSNEAELHGIGKITISSVLSDFKSKYEDDFFNDIDEELLTEVGGAIPAFSALKKGAGELSQEEIQLLKKLVQERAENQNAELIELKLALKNAGIDYTMILKDYRTQKELELKEWEGSGTY